MMADWLIIVTAIVVLWVLWKFMEYVIDLFAYAMNAAHEREDPPTRRGTGSSS